MLLKIILLSLLLMTLVAPVYAVPPNYSADVDYIVSELSWGDDNLPDYNYLFADGKLRIETLRLGIVPGYYYARVYWKNKLVATKTFDQPLVILRHGAWKQQVHAIATAPAK